MKETIAIFLAVMTSVIAAGCMEKSGPAQTERMGKKVADRRLNVYSSVRRLSYRDACGRNGPITICVDGIVISDAATIIETRITNSSPQAYSNGNVPRVAVLRGMDPSERLDAIEERPCEPVQPGERRLLFRADRHFEGDPMALSVDDIGKPAAGIPPAGLHEGHSLLVKFDG